MKWVRKGGLYTFEITECDGMFDLDVFCLKERDAFWFRKLETAKQFVRKEYEGVKFDGRWEKVKDDRIQ
jgi:hypothetical protein